MTGSRNAAGGRLPNFLIIGAAKCATSTLHEQLAAQPGFFMSTPKEPCFFSDDDVHAHGMDWYRGLFAGAAPDDLCGESSTHYTKLPNHPRTVERLLAAYPDDPPRLVYLMRHPVARLLSQYVHMWTEAELDCGPDEAVDRYPELIDYGCYHRQLEPYIEHWGTGAILPVFFDRIKTQPDAELARVAGFVGHEGPVAWDPTVSRVNVSSERLRVSPWRDRIIEAPVLSGLRRRFVPRTVRNKVKRVWQYRGRPELSARSRRRVEGIFDADLARLGELLDVPLSCATFVELTRDHALDWAGDRHELER